MNLLLFCVIIGSLVGRLNSLQQYYFVIAPNVIRFEHNETITVSIFGNHRDVDVTVWLEHRGKRISETDVTVSDEQHPVQITMGVKEDDIFDTVVDEKPRNIKLCSRRRSDNTICRDLILSYKTGYLIIQTDKPIYTPLQKVKIRVLTLDESLKVVTDDKRQVAMDIVSPSNLTLGRRIFKTTRERGFYTNIFKLPPYPETGIWTARAFYKGQYETVSRSLFQVEEYVLPNFGVTIDVSEPYILQTTDRDRSIDITVKAKYVYGKPVEGTARLTLNITGSTGYNQYLLDITRASLEDGVKGFSITVGEIFDALGDRTFPDGHRLLVVATVLERATGKEEATFHEETIFAAAPYKFKFTRCKKYFRPGMDYYVQVDMQTANGLPAKDMNIAVQKLDEWGHLLEQKTALTNSKGQALAIFSVSNSKTFKFKVIGPERNQESEILEVTAYDDKNQIHVERVITKDNLMLMQAFTNIQLDSSGNAKSGYTGLMFMLVSRGKVEHVVFKPASNKASEQISEKLQELINPSARLLVFYVDEGTDNVVADSVKFDVEPKCRGADLSLTPDLQEYVPGEKGKLTIAGNKLAWVGLNAMDKSLLLLNDENVLKKNKMFDVLKSHDLGCGEGSGRNNGDVFKNAGLTVLTNARIENDVDRRAEGCDRKKRRKRHLSSDECYGADFECCNYAYEYADIVFYEVDEDEHSLFDPYVKCYARAKNMTFKKELSTQCIMAFFLTCKLELESLISDVTQVFSKSLDDVSDYASDLELVRREGIKPYKRAYFRESFLFDEVQLSSDGTHEMIYNYPDSITEWMIQAIGISDDKGLCIADPVDVRVFREFFIQLDLPYKATRFEMFDVRATLFNYGLDSDPVKTVNMYMQSVEGLCYSNEPGKQSPKQVIEIGPNSAQTVRFPVVPVKDGFFSVIVTAVQTEFGKEFPNIDVIEKKLLVVNEGIQETIILQVCLDPYNQKDDCESTKNKVTTQYGNAPGTGIGGQISKVDLTLPEIAIPGTGSATAYVQGNIMDNVVKIILSGAESLFRKPGGCGEQNMAATAPNVYAMMYLKQTKQVTASAETVDSNIRQGVDHQKTNYMHDDGSYSIYKSTTTSTWLTAFVAKVFCHAKEVVDDALEADDINPTILWLNNHIDHQGQFKEIRQVGATYMMGQTKVDSPGFTAFVLISLLECNILPSTLARTVDLATRYIENLDENWLKNHPYDLAICTYALALAKSNKKDDFNRWLHSIERTSGENIYWGYSDSFPADAYSIETTAYALLAMLQFNDLKTSAHIVRWLTSQQNARGTFQSTQDTYVALQGLTEYSIRTYTADLDLNVTLIADGWKGAVMPVRNNRFQLQTVKDLPVAKVFDGQSTMTVEVTGTTGSGRMRIELRYNRPAEDDEICPFEISKIEIGEVNDYPIDKNIGNLRECDVCGHCSKDPVIEDISALSTTESNIVAESNFGRRKRQAEETLNEDTKCVRFSVRAKDGHQHSMSMMYFNLETDVTVKQEDLEKLMKENDNIDQYEMPAYGKGFIVFYLNTLTSEADHFIFRLVDNYKGDKNIRQPASVDVFDYYNPDKYCRKMYGTGPNKEVPARFTCSAHKKHCSCLQSMCSKSVKYEIRQMAINQKKHGKRPAAKLRRYTCTAEKANYAVLVEVTDVRNDSNSIFTVAKADVVRSIHRGTINQEPGDTLTFFWKISCNHPELNVGKQYYIIAKDGIDVETTNNANEYRYPLMGTALVIEKPSRRMKLFKTVMDNYEKLMKQQGCVL